MATQFSFFPFHLLNPSCISTQRTRTGPSVLRTLCFRGESCWLKKQIWSAGNRAGSKSRVLIKWRKWLSSGMGHPQFWVGCHRSFLWHKEWNPPGLLFSREGKTCSYKESLRTSGRFISADGKNHTIMGRKSIEILWSVCLVCAEA